MPGAVCMSAADPYEQRMVKALSFLAVALVLAGCGSERLTLNGKATEVPVERTFQFAAESVANEVERVCDKAVPVGFVRGRIGGANYEHSALGPMRGHFSDERRTIVYETMTSALTAELGQRGYKVIAEHVDTLREAQVDGVNYGKKGVELAQEDVAGTMIRIDLSAQGFYVESSGAEVFETPAFHFSIVDVKSKVVLARVNVD